MFTVILCMFAGLIAGFLIRKVKISFLNGVILTLILALLFLLGYEVGINKEVVHRFPELGLEALLIALFATLGSITAAKMILPPKSQPHPRTLSLRRGEKEKGLKEANSSFKISFADLKNLKGSLIILFFFVAGLILGIFRIIPEGIISSNVSFFVLCGLMFSVGFSLGHQPETIKQFRHIPARTLLLPFTTMVGTFVGAILIGFFFTHTLTETLAVSSGFGYYSLSGILITQYKGAELGTIALLANIFREIITLVFAPQMVRYFGRLAPIAAGGATTMDTTFPIIVQTSGKEFAIVSVYSGFVLDFSVPFLVTLWCSL